MVSEYQEKFPAHFATATRTAKKLQDAYQPPEGKMANVTTFRLDYVPHEVTMRPPKVCAVYVPPEGSMSQISTYAQDYQKYMVQKNLVTKTEVYNPPPAKMDAKSTYKEEFRTWHAEKRQPCRTADNLTLNEGKFTGTTTFRDDYRPKGVAMARENFKPPAEVRESLPFDGATNYKLQYVSYPVQARQPREKLSHRPTSAPFHGVSTTWQDYRGLPGEAPKPARAKVAWKSSTATFQGTSEFRAQYKAWPVAAKQPRKAEEYTAPEGDMAFLSTTHADYVGYECRRQRSARPPVQAWVRPDEPLQGQSVTKQDYRPWEAPERRVPTVHADAMARPTGAFEKTTTFRSHYTPKTAERRPSCKPAAQRQPSSEPMEENTVYRSSYTGNQLGPCPTGHTEPPGFEYTRTRAGGHRLYHAVSVADTCLAQQATVDKDQPSHRYSQNRKSCVVKSRDRRAH